MFVSNCTHRISPDDSNTHLILRFEASDDLLLSSMEKVFTVDLSTLELIKDTRVFHIPDFLKWSSVPVPFIYWRECYTYLLCSITAGLQLQYDRFRS
jgi:hypothetical protein